MWIRNEQTICAISTPHGVGGIAVIRISGSRALDICKKISRVLEKKEKIESHKAYFSNIFDLENNKIDEVIITYFLTGKSFTGEEVIEISCHGSRFVTQQILDLLVKCGCRIADRGEFTYRAFMNGKIDLIQAESILSLIESQSKASAQVALRQLNGDVSKEYENIISDLTWCLAHIEASIDFIEQGVEVVDVNILILKLNNVVQTLSKLSSSYESGRIIKDGVRVALIGEPNVGKSSLLNLLLQTDKAIVTPIAGTTRDIIEGEIIYSGTKFNLSDTAGLRETSDEIEIIGIDKSKKEAIKADIMAFVFDSTAKDFTKSLQAANQIKHSKKIAIINKADLLNTEQKTALVNYIKPALSIDFNSRILFTTSFLETSRDELFSAVIGALGNIEFLDAAIISSARQFEQTRYAIEMITKSIIDLEENIGAEFVSMQLKEGLVSLQQIVGQVYDDQILDRIFKEFCLGK